MNIKGIRDRCRNRLELAATNLASKFRRASTSAQRKACLAACKLAVKKAKVEHPMVRESLHRLRSGQVFTRQEKVNLDALGAEIDDKYLSL